MNPWFKAPFVIALTATALAAAIEGSAGANAPFLSTDLGLLHTNDQFSQAFSVNNYGQVAGFCLLNALTTHAFLWTPTAANGTNGAMLDLGPCLGGFDGGLKVNSYGQVLFNQVVPTPTLGMQPHPFLWTPATPNGTNGSATDLLTLIGTNGAARGYGLSDNGAVVGFSNPGECFIWTPSSPNASSGTMAAFDNSYGGQAYALNNAGQVTGSFLLGYPYPILHSGPGAYSTNDIIGPGPQAGGQNYSGYGYAINAAGHVAGAALLPGAAGLQPFLYTGANLLNVSPSVGSGDAYGVNSADLVVGTTSFPGFGSGAFLYAGGARFNLQHELDPASGWTGLDPAHAINDFGQIVGVGTHNGQTRTFLLTPAGPVLLITAIARVAQDIHLTWLTVGGTTNQVQVANGSLTAGFTDLGTAMVIAGLGLTTTNYVDLGGATNFSARFYRIRLVP